MRWALPLTLLAAMVVIATGIETALTGAPNLPAKLPLVALLVWSAVRTGSARKR